MPVNFDATGTLGGDPEQRFTQSGKSVVSMSLAVNDGRKQDDGSWSDETSWYRLTLWEGLGINAVASLTKGMRVMVKGKLRMRQFEKPDGTKGLSADVTVDEIGPSLRRATAQVTKVTDDQGGGGMQRSGSAPQQDDPWGQSQQKDPNPPF